MKAELSCSVCGDLYLAAFLARRSWATAIRFFEILFPTTQTRSPLNQKTLLVCFAHPDDESFGPGGTLARYAREGVAVHLACATRGEVGMVDPEFMQGHDSVGDMRWAELTCAADVLGLASITHLGYRDSGMPGSPDNLHPQALASAPLDEVAGKIVRLIRDLKPQVVLTFDPIGGYRHPDHIAIHEATVRAFEAASDPARYPEAGPAFRPARLYYHTFARGALRWAVRLMPLFRQDPTRFGRNKDVDILSLAGVEFPVTTVIRVRDYAAIKAAATACHRSQLASLPADSLMLRLMMRLAGNNETFMRACPPFTGGRRERGFFAGL